MFFRFTRPRQFMAGYFRKCRESYDMLNRKRIKCKITKQCGLLILIALTAAVFMIFTLTAEESTNELESIACLNKNQHWFHRNQNYVNQKILTKLNGSNVKKSTHVGDYKWQEVIPHIYIYSAFNDSCDISDSGPVKPCIKILSVVLRHHSMLENIHSQFVCFTKDNGAEIGYTSVIKYTEIKEHHGKCFGAAFIECLQPLNQPHPAWISIDLSPEALPVKWIPTFKYKFEMKELSVCVRPLYGPFNLALQLVEFISYYIEAGAEHFYFYDQSIAPEIYHLLELLSRHVKATIIILPWKLPVDNELVHENGQLAHIQDCILRCRNEFKHTVVVDIDEYIVPQQHKDLVKMLDYLDKEYHNAGSYVFPMALFCNEYLYQIEQTYSVLPLVTHSNVWRQKTLWYYKERSKVIVKPNAIKVGGIHYTWEHNRNYRTVWVPADVAIVQHYRNCCGIRQTWILHLVSFRVLSDKRVKDTSLLAFKSKMLGNPAIKLLEKLIV